MTNAAPVGNHVSQLAQELFKEMDKNGDNKLSKDEFQAFFQNFVQQLGTHEQTQHLEIARADAAPDDPANPANPDDYIYAGLPDAADYAARGYDFDHPDPHHLKPIISKMLHTGEIAPTHDWVTPELVARLNAMAGLDASDPDAFHALDRETIAFSGNEYVHSAPVGHGLLPGQYDPHAKGEFLWGWWDV